MITCTTICKLQCNIHMQYTHAISPCNMYIDPCTHAMRIYKIHMPAINIQYTYTIHTNSPVMSHTTWYTCHIRIQGTIYNIHIQGTLRYATDEKQRKLRRSADLLSRSSKFLSLLLFLLLLLLLLFLLLLPKKMRSLRSAPRDIHPDGRTRHQQFTPLRIWKGVYPSRRHSTRLLPHDFYTSIGDARRRT